MTGIACFHCLRVGHWQNECPYLQLPADKDHHEARIATIRMRFLEFQIGPLDRTRMILKEKELWKERQQQMKEKETAK